MGSDRIGGAEKFLSACCLRLAPACGVLLPGARAPGISRFAQGIVCWAGPFIASCRLVSDAFCAFCVYSRDPLDERSRECYVICFRLLGFFVCTRLGRNRYINRSKKLWIFDVGLKKRHPAALDVDADTLHACGRRNCCQTLLPRVHA
jgi:hypothetical protein